jgi:hypothetical protein
MTDIAGLTYCEITFDADGTLTSDGGLPGAAHRDGVTDVFVLCHGWNNSEESARTLYQGLGGLLAKQLGADKAAAVAVGVFWPSLLFPEDDPQTSDDPSTGKQLAAALAPSFPQDTTALDEMGRLIDEQPQDGAELAKFHQLASGLVTTPALAKEDEGPAAAITAPASAVLGHAAALTPSKGGDAQALGNPFKTLWSGAREVLRTMSYYEMKNRAGVVGQKGLGPFIASVTKGTQLRVHLMGHSFGARLVSYALTGLPKTSVGAASPVKSLMLVQGAFSHFAFADPTPCRAVRKGSLSAVRNRVDGPMLSTFSAADRAVGWWYPNASMLAHQDAQSLADLAYQWGGMGHDGFQQASPGGTGLTLKGTKYPFAKGGIYLLDANAVIKKNLSAFSGAHSDIVHDEVVAALVAAAAVSRA